jgi:hypothetical protein
MAVNVVAGFARIQPDFRSPAEFLRIQLRARANRHTLIWGRALIVRYCKKQAIAEHCINVLQQNPRNYVHDLHDQRVLIVWMIQKQNEIAS